MIILSHVLLACPPPLALQELLFAVPNAINSGSLAGTTWSYAFLQWALPCNAQTFVNLPRNYSLTAAETSDLCAEWLGSADFYNPLCGSWYSCAPLVAAEETFALNGTQFPRASNLSAAGAPDRLAGTVLGLAEQVGCSAWGYS